MTVQHTHICVLTVCTSLCVCVCVSRQANGKQMATKLPQASVQTTCFPNLMIMSYLWVNTRVCVSVYVSLHPALHAAHA